MQDARFRGLGMFIGSGTAGAGCKAVIGQRLKLSGMRWSVPGATGIATLRCQEASGRWEEIWQRPHSQTAATAPAICSADTLRPPQADPATYKVDAHTLGPVRRARWMACVAQLGWQKPADGSGHAGNSSDSLAQDTSQGWRRARWLNLLRPNGRRLRNRETGSPCLRPDTGGLNLCRSFFPTSKIIRVAVAV